MKTIILNIVLLISILNLNAQDTIKSNSGNHQDSFFEDMPVATKNSKVIGGLKHEDNVLPRMVIDITYRRGITQNDLTLMNIKSHYTNPLGADFSKKPTFSNGIYNGVNLQFGYFLGKSRRMGLGIGMNWMRYSGNISMQKYQIQYQSKDSTMAHDIFRQILNGLPLESGNAIEESITSNNFMIPIMFKFKHQVKNKKWGYTADAGLMLGISNSNNYDGRGRFSYDAVYKYNTSNEGIYDQGIVDNETRSITQDYWVKFPTSEGGNNDNAVAYFKRLREEGFNVALDTTMTGNGKNPYTSKVSLGFLFQPSFTYYLGYNTTFMLGGFYSYQVYKNIEDNKYQLTNNVGVYHPISEGVKKNVVSSYGINIGFRFFFGEKRDLDGDGILDKDDKCPKIPGKKNLAGCPDSDDDGVKDEDDKCKDEYGSKDCAGCPDDDNDLIANREDACPNEPGVGSSIPKYNGCPLVKMFAEQAEALGYTKTNSTPPPQQIEDYFEVLQKDFINFEYGKAFVLPSNLIVLDNAVTIMQSNPNLVMLVSGHTDNIGTFATNMKLSLERANAVKGYLVGKGIDKDRIVTVGYAYERPISDNTSEQGRATNRRTEMKLLSPLRSKK